MEGGAWGADGTRQYNNQFDRDFKHDTLNKQTHLGRGGRQPLGQGADRNDNHLMRDYKHVICNSTYLHAEEEGGGGKIARYVGTEEHKGKNNKKGRGEPHNPLFPFPWRRR